MGILITKRIGATLAVVAIAAGGLTAAGCGGDSTSAASTASSAATATAASADNGVASLSGPEILAKAQTAAKAATSVTVVGTVPQGSSPISIDMAVGNGEADGTITVKNVTVQIRVTGGKTYINAPAALFEKMGGSAGKIAGTVLGGKWFEVPSTGAVASSFNGIDNIANKDTLFASLLSAGKNPTVKGTDTVSGQPAVILSGPNGGTLAVATTGEPYPLQVKAKSGSTGSVDFKDWNVPVNVTVPTDLVDLGALTGAASSS